MKYDSWLRRGADRRCAAFSPATDKHQGRRCHRQHGHEGEHECVSGDGGGMVWPAGSNNPPPPPPPPAPKKRIVKKKPPEPAADEPPTDVDLPLVAQNTKEGWGSYPRPAQFGEDSQPARVLRYMLLGSPWSVTPSMCWDDAMDGKGQIQRLAAVICILRQHCYAIKTDFDKSSGKAARYYLVKKTPCPREASGECLYWTPRLKDCVQWGMLNEAERTAYNQRVRVGDPGPTEEEQAEMDL